MSRPRTYSRIEVAPVTGRLGAEVGGIDAARDWDTETVAELRRALTEHLVVFLRDQSLSPSALERFSTRLGRLLRVPYIEPMAGHPEIIEVRKEPEERGISTFGGTWHSDFSFLERPPMATVLHAVDVPQTGGDTLWADGFAAYEALSPGLRRALDGLNAMHSGHVYGARRPPKGIRTSASIAISRGNPEADIERAHPVVRLHPESGRKALFVNPVYTTRFEEMTEEESRPLLDYLYAHCTRPEFTCRFGWRPGSLAIWDNRCTMHLAVNDYDGSRRLMHRTTIAGERPIGAESRGTRP